MGGRAPKRRRRRYTLRSASKSPTAAFTLRRTELERQRRRADAVHRREVEARRKQDYFSARKNETQKLNEAVSARVGALTNLVVDATRRTSWALDFESLKESMRLPEFDPMGSDRPIARPTVEAYLPKSPSRLVRTLFPKGTKGYRDRMATGTEAYQDALRRFQAKEATRINRHTELMTQYEARCAAEAERVRRQHEGIDAFHEQYLAGHPIAVGWYFKTILELDGLPDGVPRSVDCRYSADGELFIARPLPPRAIIPSTLSYRYIKTRDEIQRLSRPAGQSQELYTMVAAQLIIRTFVVVFASDLYGRVKSAQFDPILPDDVGAGAWENGVSGSIWCTATGLRSSLDEAGFDALATLRALGQLGEYKAHLLKLLLREHGLPLHWEILGQMAT
jgi:hypothetical protein